MTIAIYIIAGLFVVGWVAAMAYLAGQLSILGENLREANRHLSWAQVRQAQAAYNVDFFDELYKTNDSRLKGIDYTYD